MHTAITSDHVNLAADRLVDLIHQLDIVDEDTPRGSIPFVDLHDECDPNELVDEVVHATFDIEALTAHHGTGSTDTPYLDACNAVVDEYERRRVLLSLRVLTDREAMLIREALQRLDPDTLNDDLDFDSATSGDELDTLASRFAR